MVNITEQLKIAINYWTKVLNESEESDRYKKATYDFKMAILHKTIDENNLNIVFDCNYQSSFKADENNYTAVLANLKITDFNAQHGLCICDQLSNGSSSHTFYFQIVQNTNDIFTFLIPSRTIVKQLKHLLAYIDRIENNIIYLKYINLKDHNDQYAIVRGLDNQYNVDFHYGCVYKYFTKIVNFHDTNLHQIYARSSPCGINTAEVIVDSGITTIGGYVFEHCTSLKTVKFPNTIKTIQGGVFSDTGIETIELPDSIEYIRSYAFSDCKSLKHIKMPNKLRYLDNNAFLNSTIENMTLYMNFYVNQSKYFINDMPELTTLNIAQGNILDEPQVSPTAFYIYNCPKLEIVSFEKGIVFNEELLSYYNTALIFDSCPNLKIIYVPDEQSKKFIMNKFTNVKNNPQIQVIVKG